MVVVILFCYGETAYASSKRLFDVKWNGFQCVGDGVVHENFASAKFTATLLPYEMALPDEMYECIVYTFYYDSEGKSLGTDYEEGNLSCHITESNFENKLYHMRSHYDFEGHYFGEYNLYR